MTQDYATLPLDLDNRTVLQMRGALTGNELMTRAMTELNAGNLRNATGPLHMLIGNISQLMNDGRTVDLNNLNNPHVLEVVLRGQIEIIGVYARMLEQIGLPADDPAIKVVALLTQTFDTLFPLPAAEPEKPQTVSEHAVLEPIGAMAAALAMDSNYNARQPVLQAIATFVQHMLSSGRLDDLQLPATNLKLLRILEELIRVQSPLQIEKILKSLLRARVLAEAEMHSDPHAMPLTTLASDGSGVRG